MHELRAGWVLPGFTWEAPESLCVLKTLLREPQSSPRGEEERGSLSCFPTLRCQLRLAGSPPAAHAASLPRRLHPLLPRARKPLNPAPCTLGSCTLGSCTLHPYTLQLCNPAALQPAPCISAPLHSTASPHPFHGSGGDPNSTQGTTGMKSSHQGSVLCVWTAAPCPGTGDVPQVPSPQPAHRGALAHGTEQDGAKGGKRKLQERCFISAIAKRDKLTS